MVSPGPPSILLGGIGTIAPLRVACVRPFGPSASTVFQSSKVRGSLVVKTHGTLPLGSVRSVVLIVWSLDRCGLILAPHSITLYGIRPV